MNQNGVRTVQNIGIEVHGGGAVVLIPAGSLTPVARAMTFTTVTDGQMAVEVRIVRCACTDTAAGVPPRAGVQSTPGGVAADGRSDGGVAAREGVASRVGVARPAGLVGRFLVPGLRRSSRGEARIDIGISLDREGVIRAWGTDRHTGARQEATFPGLWALGVRARPDAVSRLERRVAKGLADEEDARGLREESRLVGALAGAEAGTFLAALAGEIDVLRRSSAEPPLRP